MRVLFQDEGRFGRISDARSCRAPLPLRPAVGSQLVREYVYAYRENDIRNQIFNTLDKVMDTVETSLRHLHEAPEELRSMTAFPWIVEKAA
jgi:hypothetical protein